MFSPQFRPIVGGAERQAEKLARALAQLDVDVAILTPLLDSSSPTLEEHNGIVIHRFPLFDVCKAWPRVRGLGLINLLSLRHQVVGAMERHARSADVVHLHIASPLSAFAMQAAKRYGLPVLCKLASSGERPDLGELANVGLGGKLALRSMLASLDRWVATSQAVVDSLSAWNISPRRIARIPNGVEVHTASLRLKREKRTKFLYLGRMSRTAQRDLPTLVRAFDRLSTVYPGVELALVGEGDLYEETFQIVSQAKNRHRIRMPGLQGPAEWLEWADCFVLPSRYEGLSNSLLEAMAQGLPSIANDIPANREVLDNGSAGLLVPVGDEDCLFEVMRTIVTKPVVGDDMARAALKRVRREYGIDQVASRYVNMYRELMEEAKAKSHARED